MMRRHVQCRQSIYDYCPNRPHYFQHWPHRLTLVQSHCARAYRRSYLIVALGLNQAQIISVLAFTLELPALIYLLLWRRNSAHIAVQP
jgi:hypothetical protein